MSSHDDDDDRWLKQLAGREPGDPETQALRQVLLDYAREQHESNEFQKKKRQIALINRLRQENLLPPAPRAWRWPEWVTAAPRFRPWSPALAAGLAVALIGGWLWHYELTRTLPDYSDNFYDYPQSKGLLDHLPVRKVADLDATLRQWKRLFMDNKLPYRITADPNGKIVEVWVSSQAPAAFQELLKQEQLAPGADGWLRVLVREAGQDVAPSDAKGG